MSNSSGYSGVDSESLSTIKKPNESEMVSKEEFEKRILAISKSKRDITWWAQNFFRIIPASGGLQTIKLYPKQAEMLKCFQENRNTITLASRQIGKCFSRNTKVTIKHKTLSFLKFKISVGFLNFIANLFIKNQVDPKYPISNKFISILNFSNWQVETENGFEDITGIGKTVEYEKYIVKLENGLTIECADDHIFIDENHNEVFAKDSLGKNLITKDGLKSVISVIKTGKFEHMYDLMLADDTSHCYYTNGILSHNTTCYTVFCMWFATLFPEKKIMICANKLQTAVEVMDRIRLAYEYLPSWIKPGVTVYNKTEISFSNRSSIRAFATSSSASRGFSGNCVNKWTLVTIRFKNLKWFKLKLPIYLIKYFSKKKYENNIFNESEVIIDKSQINLHDNILRTYNKINLIDSIEILSDNNSWENIESLNIIYNSKTIKLITKFGRKLICSPNHILIDEFGKELFAKDSLNKNIKSIDGIDTIIKIVEDKNQELYDLSLSDNGNHTYFTNGILSHNCVIIDEMAFIPKNIIDEFFASTMPIISSVKDSKAILVSTPNGASGLYYDIWMQANSKNQDKNTSGWKPFRVDWWEVPGRDEKWKEQQIATVGIDRWRQEFCNEFAVGSSSLKLIPDDIIEKYKMKLSEYKLRDTLSGKKQKFISASDDNVYEFTMWHEFNPDHTYMASGDVAEGTATDQSVLYVWDITDLRNIIQCAKFDSPSVSPMEFAYITNKILGLYGNPYYICESNGVGAGYLDALTVTYQYPNVVREGKDNKYGITSHVILKGKACLWAKDMFTTAEFSWTIYDKELIDEMVTFIKKDSKQHLVYQAMAKAHDDHIMSLIWGAWLLNPDIIDSYYIVSTTATTILDQIVPQRVSPLKEYENVERIINDPIYKEFLEYKEEMLQQLGHTLDEEAKTRKAMKQKNILSFDQMFFGEDDDLGSWNSNPQNDVPNINQGTSIGRMPTFTINRGYW